jgi:drug/metabolite transporter (DMT)-like permease
MGFEIGVLLALGALVCWGCGDFLIQGATRKVGDWETLLFISAFGVVVLLPFVFNDMVNVFLSDETTLLILGVSIFILVAAMLDFEALRRGKISIIEPVLALEVPVTAVLSFFVLNEVLSALALMLISTLILGLILISVKAHHLSKKARTLERGIFIGAGGALFLGLTNFFLGYTSRLTNPLLVNWFMSLFLTFACIFYLHTNKRLGRVMEDFHKNRKLVLSASLADNMAWIFVAVAMTLIPIAIAVAISESYIALASLLGLMINKETLLKHQMAGLVLVLASAVALSAMY